MSNAIRYLEMLIDTIKLLAMGYEEQQRSLPDFVCLPDELVLSFSDAYSLLDQITNAGLVSEKQQVAVHKIEKQFVSMDMKNNGKENPWSDNAVRYSDDWNSIRTLAREALLEFGITEFKPNLSWITYIKGKR
jgi:hypothetical protein